MLQQMCAEAVAPDGMGGSNLTPESGTYGGDMAAGMYGYDNMAGMMAAGMYGDTMAAGVYGYGAPVNMVAPYAATVGYGGCALPTNAHLMRVV